MQSSSQEYLITKVGMPAPKTRRSKPLRTYGKRSLETRGEPPTKKRRTGDEMKTAEKETEGRHVLAEKENPPSAEQGRSDGRDEEKVEKPVDKGSIMSYFKPAATPQSPKTTSAIEETPPCSSSSPALSPRSRRLRRFGVKEPTSGDTSLAPEAEGSASGRSLGRRGSRRIAEASKKSAATKTGVSVQTTLNISPQAAFSECKTCNTVYNPLYPDDVKYHTKRHAAVLRAKRKRDEGDSVRL